MSKLENKLSWSFSRHNIFNECKRRYYFNYYLSWEGWNNYAPKDKQLAYALKKLTNRYMWKGDVFHRLMEASLKRLKTSGEFVPIKESRDWIVETCTQEYRNSLNHVYWGQPKGIQLIEDVYEGEYNLDAFKVDEIIDDLITMYETFFDSRLKKSLEKLNKNKMYSIEELTNIVVNDVPVWIKIDLLFMSDKNKLCITDWKTGRRSSENVFQLGVYGVYVNENYNDVELENVVGLDVYMKEGRDKFESKKIEKVFIEESKSFIKNSICEMKAYLTNEKTNKPKTIGHFPKINSELKGACKNCSFRKLCFSEEVNFKQGLEK